MVAKKKKIQIQCLLSYLKLSSMPFLAAYVEISTDIPSDTLHGCLEYLAGTILKKVE